ncbi:DUF3563 family protein [Oxalobacteraceae bacterium]|nr:DUF3563 family protein [Oxalobacteraceae bacterium]
MSIARDSAAVLYAVRALFARVAGLLNYDAEQRARARDEAYLAESGDRYELEFRMRELERAPHQVHWMHGFRG